jgi:hypothetical protein
VRCRLADGDYARREVVSVVPADDWRHRDADAGPHPLLGQEGRFVCILIEHQSVPDPVMPLRLVYAVLFWERQWREWRRDTTTPNRCG